MTEARTQAEIFQEFKKAHNGDGVRWKEWWLEEWKRNIGEYAYRGWQMIALGNRNKRPVGPWTEERLTESQAIRHISKNGNLGIVAGDDLVILDYDSHAIDPSLLTKTLTCITSRGYLFFTKPPYDGRTFNSLKKKYINFDTPRVDVMYALVPLSVTCIHENDKSHDCTRHDYRVREWLDPKKSVIPFKEFAKA